MDLPLNGRHGGRAGCWVRAYAPLVSKPSSCGNCRRSTTTQIYEGTNQIQRMVMARQLLK
jgi:alkylation response protein AidB-like acyl-CoA dehydrogenase